MPRPRATTPTYSLARVNGVWYVQWWQDGGSKRTSCRTADIVEARVFREALISALGTPPPPPSPTIGCILDAYETDKAGKVHSQAITFASRALKRHLENVPTASLTPKRVADYLTLRRAEGAGGAPAKHRKTIRALSDGTLRRELGVLRAALGWAVTARWIASAPVVDLPPTQPARDRWLTRAEARALLAASPALHVRTFLALALFTAGRAGAILDLTWQRVDETAGTIRLGDGAERGKKRRQTVPIASDLTPYLAAARAAATSEWVVEYRSKKIASLKKGVAQAVAIAGLPGVTPHVLRHTAATWMMQEGVPIAMVAGYLGNTVAMVEKHYGHHAPEWLRQGAAALNLNPRHDAEAHREHKQSTGAKLRRPRTQRR